MMDINEIREILPHRYPFLLVDRVTEVVEGKSIKGYKNVTIFSRAFSRKTYNARCVNIRGSSSIRCSLNIKYE